MEKRNGKIELMRFVFAVGVVLFHLNYTYWGLNQEFSNGLNLFRHGNLGVEFFFIVSGFLMARTLSRQREQEALAIAAAEGSGKAYVPSPLGDETLRFLWRKVKSFLPYHILFQLLMLAARVAHQSITFSELLNQVSGFFLLQRTGLFGKSLLTVEWYLSSMLLAMAILYPIARRWYSSYTHLFGPLCALLLLGWLYQETGKLADYNDWSGLTYYCNLRALAELSLGMTCYEVCQQLAKRTLTFWQRLLVTLVEGGCYLGTLLYFCSGWRSKLGFLTVFALCVAITLSFSQKGLLGESRLFQNRVCDFLGRLSMPIFLGQNVARSVVPYLLDLEETTDYALPTFIGVLLVGVASYLLVSTVQKRMAARRVAFAGDGKG